MTESLPPDIDSLTEKIIGCGIAVHRALGPGLLESVYEDCLVVELRAAGLCVEVGRKVKLSYRGKPVGTRLRLDLLVENRVIVEVKAVERIHPVHKAQLITYLKLTGCPVGLLMNFNVTSLRQGLKRLVHPNLYSTKQSPDLLIS